MGTLFAVSADRTAVDVVLAVLVPGHLADPKQAPDYKTFTFARRLLRLRPDLHQLWKDIWAKRALTAAKTMPGLVGNVLRIAASFNWVPITPFCFSTTVGEFHLISGPQGPWHHDLREATRRKQHLNIIKNLTSLERTWLGLLSIPSIVPPLPNCCVQNTTILAKED